ncbi:hypothetical protein MmiEs2_11360 [Methanimicrococcus stummii]|uniref:DNA methylase N-4/N-6 domain-containing protein n=1 Tax=Methanimicrococcus stummii TaxID=3028294 RepID=A0AA96VBM2_9EURY|nr:site-specific DNA-methyltransferase [Methanimicrococcus sp. Es2]WNY28923.1 hypothetical protein MmiEs2_11360 [Methanimicrococcus sp. Es2]
MDKMHFETSDFASELAEKIAALAPSVVTEKSNGGGGNQQQSTLKRAINFDLLRTLLGDDVADDEAYEFTWVGKREAVMEAGKPIRKTLRPCPEESKSFDSTENLYIEGDNLDVLKLLQESYLGKVKMIYIDPPYNTGNDFVYRDNFTQSHEEYEEETGVFDEDGERLFKNTESNGRFHSDWCSMIYPRLVLARNLLSEDGVIFVSIDDHEVGSLRKICDEIFGSQNFAGEIIRKTKSMTGDSGIGFNLQHENLLLYAKNINHLVLKGEKKDYSNYSNPDNDSNGDWCIGDPSAKSGGQSTYFEIMNPYTGKSDFPPNGRYWAFSKETLQTYIKSGKITFKKNYSENERGFIFKRYKKDASSMTNPVNSLFAVENNYMNQNATTELSKLFGVPYFSYPKPVLFIYDLVRFSTNKEDIVLDFFSGSATTAHAVMQLNTEDGGNRKFIMVQLPEKIDENSEIYNAGYKNICEIGKERIRRAGDKIKEENKAKESIENLDIGFRVLKLDDSNMKDVYYAAGSYTQDLLSLTESNIKDDRNDMDLLYGCLLDWGLPLSQSHKTEEIDGVTVHTYNDGDLIACFADKVSEKAVKEIAERQPLRVVFRDSSFSSSPDKINVEEIFKLMAPNTTIKVI